jgi:hypothetical protein
VPFLSLEHFFNYFSGQEVQKRGFDADSKNFEFDPKMGGRLLEMSFFTSETIFFTFFWPKSLEKAF